MKYIVGFHTWIILAFALCLPLRSVLPTSPGSPTSIHGPWALHILGVIAMFLRSGDREHHG